jgi:hypothetical protein
LQVLTQMLQMVASTIGLAPYRTSSRTKALESRSAREQEAAIPEPNEPRHIRIIEFRQVKQASNAAFSCRG